ncbi:MAG: sensor histidine kinase [Huintestinicola sp.]
MIKALQKKFVITAMTAITILLLVLISAINIINYSMSDNQSESLLNLISSKEVSPPPMNHNDRNHNGPKFFPNEQNPDDKERSARFFTVKIDEKGEIAEVNIDNISSVTEEEAKELAQKILSSGKEKGKTGHFKFRIVTSGDGQKSSIVFLDTYQTGYNFLMVLCISVFAGILCWLLMLLILVVLSKKAIKPIAVNIEKQKEFVTNAGHEIKTPLAIILANTDALELNMGENKWTKNIRSQTVRLNGLMKNLLTLSRIDEGNTKTVRTEFPVSELITETLDSFSELAAQNNVSIQSDIQQDLMIKADKDSIIQLISILLDNASKYTDCEGSIFVSLKKHDRYTVLTVKNTCADFPDIDPERLFDRFYRADSARTQKNGGYGIGLSVARAIVQSNKGSINAEYDGKYVSFIVKLQ